MKKQLLGLMTILTALGACQKNEVTSLSEDVTIHATIEEKDATRTVMDENNNILWSGNDQIIAFMKSSYGYKYQVKPAFVGKSYADFSMVSSGNGSDLSAGNEWEHNVVYYPYSEDIECLKSGANYEIEVNLPSEQVYVPDSFANGSMAMVAVSESNNITFKNVLGGIKLQLKGTQTVKSIKIEGYNNETLAGPAVVTAYTDGTKPAITMTSGASTSVTLNCGAGVQLNESKVTEFIIALPPALFSKGFKVTVTDADSKIYTVSTDKANTVIRASLLVMPPFKLGNNPADEIPSDEEDMIIPVSYVSLNYTSLKLYENSSAQLIATVGPRDATDKTVVWLSDNSAIASVDQTGIVTAFKAGVTQITATSGGKLATCMVKVSSIAVSTADYVDEYGINHGKGIAIGMAIWAPVNCGYHATDYKYGKLYQWGRKYGQGYDGALYDLNGSRIGEYMDATIPSFSEGSVSEISGNHKNNANVFYCGSLDWTDPGNNKLWNSGTESEPVKTNNDPCPEGWRVSTYLEFQELWMNRSSWTTNSDGQVGYWFSGANVYDESAPKIFIPAAGSRGCEGYAGSRGEYGLYWTSSPKKFYTDPIFVQFWNDGSTMGDYRDRASGYSVRCVLE